MKNVYITIGLLLFMTSCYKEVELTEDWDGDVFEFTGEKDRGVFELSVLPETQEFIYGSRDSSYSIQDPGLDLTLNEKPLFVKEMRVRGRTTLNFQRKSYSVRLEDPIFVRGESGGEVKKLTRFKLISMSMDYTYINNRIGFGILEQAGVMPLFYNYVEFKINGATQGVYLLVEDPEQFFQEQGSEYILRRDYHHGIEDAEYEPDLYYKPRSEYESRYKEMYSQLPYFMGEDLFEALNSQIDLNQYFRKMAIDYLLQNGDYSDEVYFYALIEQNEIRYKIIPWDYDDIFSSRPHEVGRSWGIGTLFGPRQYDTHQDILDEIGQKMIFSIEDDLDYAIARDSFLYACYEDAVADLISTFDAGLFETLFDQIEDELTPFYNDREVILQSHYDSDSTNFELWQSNMLGKKALLDARLESMRSRLHDRIQQP